MLANDDHEILIRQKVRKGSGSFFGRSVGRSFVIFSGIFIVVSRANVVNVCIPCSPDMFAFDIDVGLK